MYIFCFYRSRDKERSSDHHDKIKSELDYKESVKDEPMQVNIYCLSIFFIWFKHNMDNF